MNQQEINVVGTCWYKGRRYSVIEVDAHNRPKRLKAMDGSFEFYAKREFVSDFVEFIDAVSLDKVSEGRTSSDAILASLKN